MQVSFVNEAPEALGANITASILMCLFKSKFCRKEKVLQKKIIEIAMFLLQEERRI
jgi:hypothetical protein